MEWLQNLTSSEALLTYGGFAAILLVVFAETGLLVGFFLPGDYFLFLAGAVCGSGKLDIAYPILVISVFVAAVVGNFSGYYIGRYLGDKLFTREESWFFKKSYLARTRLFYDKFGARALVLGRFLPIVRTFVPVFAGAVRLNFRKFSIYNITGAALWVGILISLGYYFGNKFPGIINYATYIIIGFIIITTFPVINTIRKLKDIKLPKGKE